MTLNLAVEMTGNTICVVIISVGHTFMGLELILSIQKEYRFSYIVLKPNIDFNLCHILVGHAPFFPCLYKEDFLTVLNATFRMGKNIHEK